MTTRKAQLRSTITRLLIYGATLAALCNGTVRLHNEQRTATAVLERTSIEIQFGPYLFRRP